MVRSLFLVCVGLCFISSASASELGGHGSATVSVRSVSGSAFIRIAINHHRNLGKVRITVMDHTGRTLYSEEGRSYSDELIRNLDKASFPNVPLELIVEARDLSYRQSFSISDLPASGH